MSKGKTLSFRSDALIVIHDFRELVFREKFDFEPFKPSMWCYVQIMQIRRMLTKCSASKLTYLFILKQWYLLHEFPIFLSPFYFFMRIKRFDLKKSRQNAITVGYKEAQCNSVTQSKLFNNRVTNTNWLFRRNKAEAEKTNQSHCQFSMTYDGFNPVFNGW